MSRLPAIALGVLLLAASPAPAQYFVAPGFGGGFAYRSQYHASFRGPGFHFHAHYRGFYAAPVVPLYYSYGWVPPVGPGYGPGFGNPFFLPAPPFVDAPIVPVVNNVPLPAPVNGNRNDGEFLVITPKGSVTRTEGGSIAPFVDRVAPRPEKPPVFRFDPFAEQRVVGLTEAVETNPARIVRARECLSHGEYGQAVEHLDRVLRAAPDDVEAMFLKGQAQFAAGQYVTAVVTMQDGVRRNPGWPKTAIRPRDLFGGERFDGMLATLRKDQAANPDSLALQFLLAHQLWFAGDQPDAEKLFQALAGRLKDSSAVQPFLGK